MFVVFLFETGLYAMWNETHLLEWEFSHQLLSHHHHPGHPEEENIMSRLQQSSRVEGFQLYCLKSVGITSVRIMGEYPRKNIY